MSLVRRIIVVLVGVSLAILVTVLLITPETILSLAVNLVETSWLIRVPLVILIDVIILAIIVVLVRGERGAARPNNTLLVKAQGAVADVSVESARDRLLRAVRSVPDVVSAEAEVKAVRGKADVELDVVVSRESVSIPEKQKEIDRALRQVINKQLGLEVNGKPRVHIRMGEQDVTPPVPVIVQPTPLEPAVALPPVIEPVREEPVIAAPVKESPAYTSGMALRNDDEPPPESVDPTT